MLVWSLSKENDLSVGNSGQICMVNKLEALRVRINAALQVVKGEVEDDSLGVDYFGIIFSETPVSIKVQELTRVMKQIDEVQDVRFLRMETDSKTDSMSFYFEIISVYGAFSYDYTFENI